MVEGILALAGELEDSLDCSSAVRPAAVAVCSAVCAQESVPPLAQSTAEIEAALQLLHPNPPSVSAEDKPVEEALQPSDVSAPPQPSVSLEPFAVKASASSGRRKKSESGSSSESLESPSSSGKRHHSRHKSASPVTSSGSFPLPLRGPSPITAELVALSQQLPSPTTGDSSPLRNIMSTQRSASFMECELVVLRERVEELEKENARLKQQLGGAAPPANSTSRSPSPSGSSLLGLSSESAKSQAVIPPLVLGTRNRSGSDEKEPKTSKSASSAREYDIRTVGADPRKIGSRSKTTTLPDLFTPPKESSIIPPVRPLPSGNSDASVLTLSGTPLDASASDFLSRKRGFGAMGNPLMVLAFLFRESEQFLSKAQEWLQTTQKQFDSGKVPLANLPVADTLFRLSKALGDLPPDQTIPPPCSYSSEADKKVFWACWECQVKVAAFKANWETAKMLKSTIIRCHEASAILPSAQSPAN